MAKFKPADLEERLRKAIEILDNHSASISMDDTWLTPEFDTTKLKCNSITESSTVQLNIARSEGAITSVDKLIQLTQEIESKDLIFDGLVCQTDARTLLRIEAIDQRTHMFVDNLEDAEQLYLEAAAECDGSEIKIGLSIGNTLFGLAIIKHGFFYDKYFPPHSPHETFIEIHHPKRLPRDATVDLARAYLFELGSSLNLWFAASPRPEEDGDEFPDEDELAALATGTNSLRPLLVGPGLGSVIHEYLKGAASQDEDVAILCFAKCIEHVSATVVRMKQYEDIRRRLLTREALNPSATFIDNMVALFEENRIYTKDAESIRLTIEKCCDATVLSPLSPRHITSLSSLKKDAKPADRRNALTELAACLSATRNKIAHAKANYEMTGKECPEDQLSDLARCAQHAAEQCIRWYADISPSLRKS